jgi:hypothetical protein
VTSHQERDESRQQAATADHAVQRAHQLKRSVEGQRRALEKIVNERDPEKLRRELMVVVQQMASWEESLEAIRLGEAAVLAERDRWQIAHDKLRERIDRHALEPRTTDSAGPPPSRTARTQVRPTPVNHGQDFSVIDRELERLNESMMRALASE